MPNMRTLLWMAGVAVAVNVGLEHYKARKG